MIAEDPDAELEDHRLHPCTAVWVGQPLKQVHYAVMFELHQQRAVKHQDYCRLKKLFSS